MAKPDWGELQQRFLSDHAATGVSPKDWCEAQGLNYATARRYIKKPTAQTAQKPAQKKLRTAQKEKCAEELVDDAAGAAVTAGASVTSINGVMLLSTKRSDSKRLSVNVASPSMLVATVTTTPAHLTRNALAVMEMASASLSSPIRENWRLMLRLPIPV